MTNIMFDTGPIISLTLNELLWILEELKKDYPGEFYITKSVKQELIDKPLSGKKFRFEAIRVHDLLSENILEVIENPKIEKLGKQLQNLANNVFFSNKQPIKIVHKAEIDTIAAAILLDSDAVVIEERVTRTLLEDPDSLKKHMERKLHTKITINKKNLAELQKRTKSIKILRSIELITIAYERGLLNKYVESGGVVDEKYAKKLLESVLWALKLSGSAISEKEINQIVKVEQKNKNH